MISKKNLNKKAHAIILAAMMSTVCATTAFAAEEATKIVSIPLTIVSDIDEKENITDVDITTESKLFEVIDYEITNEPDDTWEDGQKPKLKIKLEVREDEDAAFDKELKVEDVVISLTSNNTEGKEAKVTKVVRSGQEKAYVYVTLPAVGDGKYDLAIPEISWVDESTKAYWDEAEDATSYELKIYRDDKLLNAKTLTTEDNFYDFAEYFTEEGDYQYKVRAVYNKANKGEWEESDDMVVETDDFFENIYPNIPNINIPVNKGPVVGTGDKTGKWMLDDVGYWWLNPDRTWPANQWKEINGKHYFFNANGYMHKGWVFTDGQWYFTGDDGARVINTTISNCKLNAQGVWTGTPNTWFQWGKDWYYFGNDSKPAINQWVQTNGIWYYLGETGKMLTNTTTPDGYKVDANGAWIQ